MSLQICFGIDAMQIFQRCVNLMPADLVHKIVLAIEIALLDIVKIHKDQLADSQAGQRNSHIGTQAAEPGDTHNRVLQF